MLEWPALGLSWGLTSLDLMSGEMVDGVPAVVDALLVPFVELLYFSVLLRYVRVASVRLDSCDRYIRRMCGITAATSTGVRRCIDGGFFVRGPLASGL